MCSCCRRCCIRVLCLKLCSKQTFGEGTQRKNNVQDDKPPTYDIDPTEIYGDNEEVYNGSDMGSGYYVEPKSIPICIENATETDRKKETLDTLSSTNQISLNGSELKPDKFVAEKVNAEDKIYKVTGKVIVNGKEQEIKGTLKLMTDDANSVESVKSNKESLRKPSLIEQKRPDIVPIHAVNSLPNSQNTSSNTDSLRSAQRFFRCYSQDNSSIHSGTTIESRRFSSYSIPDDEETIQKVRKALKRLPVGENQQAEEIRRSSVNRSQEPETTSMRSYNTLLYSRRLSQNGAPVSEVSTIFKEIASRNIHIGQKGRQNYSQATNSNISNVTWEYPREDYNEPYDHFFSGSLRTSKSCSAYINSNCSKIDEGLYGNEIVARMDQYISLPRTSKSLLQSITKRPPVPSPRTIIFDQKHIYEVII